MCISIRKIKVWRRKHQYLIKWFILGFIAGLLLAQILTQKSKYIELISPIVQITPEIAEDMSTSVPTTAQDAPQRPEIGRASYYSVAGCLGCRTDRLMANGQRLDDSTPTVAYNYLPLNTKIKIVNTDNGKTIIVPVTDRGGFERHGKIADLSLATKNILQCDDICNIKINEI